MPSKPSTVDEYLDSLPDDRRKVIEAVRKVILKNLDKGYEEGIQYGMIGYFVPHSIYPPGYHCDPKQPLPFAGLASQKNYMSLYLYCIYLSEEEQKRFVEAWKKTGTKLDMGKSCIRFKSLDEVALNVVGDSIRRLPAKKFVAHYESVLGASRAASKSKKKTTKKKAGKKVAAKKSPTKKAATRKKLSSGSKNGSKSTAKRNGAVKKKTTPKAAIRKSRKS
ncbi:MAG: DUF1801 domain-containing protein [Phycisphaerales bacterium]